MTRRSATIAAALKKRLGREVRLEAELDETLIGGAVIRAGDVVIDGSLRSRLKSLVERADRLILKGTDMALKASEISQLIKERIENFEAAAEARDVGTVIGVTDGIVRIHGLADARYGEMLEFPENTFGLALNLEQDSVGAVVLGDYKHISEGDTVKTTGRILEVPIGEALLGRVVDSLGQPIDGKGPIDSTETAPIEKVAPGVIARKSVDQPVQTGLKSIDSMVPIGRGQRELIIGDRQTGKTAVAIDTIINQRGTGIKCIYVAIGQKASSIAGVVRETRGRRRDGAHDRRCRGRSRLCRDAVHRAVFGHVDGRVFSRPRAGCADHFRRPDQAGLGIPAGIAAAPASAGPGSISRRRVLSALAPSGTCRARQRGLR